MRHLSAPRRRGSRGITAFELCLGLAGLTALGLVVTYVVRPALEGDHRAVALREAAVIQQAASDWRASNPQGCPTLSVLLSEHQLATTASVDDPWGGRYRVRCSADRISVTSAGSDGRSGTADDVAYPSS